MVQKWIWEEEETIEIEPWQRDGGKTEGGKVCVRSKILKADTVDDDSDDKVFKL